jgi:hypothetical protein
MISIPATTTVTTSALAVCTVPPGACTVVLSNTGTNAAAIGTSSSVTSSTGFPLPAGATVTIPGFPGSKGTTLYAISSGTATIGAIVSTAA